MLLLVIGVVLFPLAFLDKSIKNNFKLILIFIVCFCFVLLGGLRWNTGTDWIPYYNFFYEADSYQNAIQSIDNFEWGFGILNWVVNTLTGSYTVFLFTFSFITVFLKFWVLKNKLFLQYSLFSLFLYYCYYIGDIVSVRQLMAASIIFASILYVVEKKKLKFILMIVLATLIHRTAIIGLIIYKIFYLNFSKKILYLIFFSSMIIGLFLFNLKIEQLNIPILSDLAFFSSYQQKIDAYSEMGQVSYGNFNTNQSIILGYIRKIIFVIPMIILYKKYDHIKGLLNISVIGSSIYFILGGIASDFRRFGTYFDVFEILLIPAIIYSIENKKIKYTLLLFYCVLAFIKLYGYIFNFWELFSPFYTILDINNFRNMY